MAFERFSINRSSMGMRPGSAGMGAAAISSMRPRPPSFGGGNVTNYKPPGGFTGGMGGGSVSARPVNPGGGLMGGNMVPGGVRPGTYSVDGPQSPMTGGELPPSQDASVGANPTVPPKNSWIPSRNRPADGQSPSDNRKKGLTSKQRFQMAFDGWIKNGAKGVFAGFPGDAILSRGFNYGTPSGGGGGGGGGKKPKPPPTNDRPVVQPPLPPTQWGNPTAPFPQNPYDVPAPLQPANNPWLASLPQRDWMTMPSASPGYEQAPPPAPWRPPY